MWVIILIYLTKNIMKISNKKAFSLIELMVVIAIIWILATAGVNMYSTYQAKARDSVRTTNMQSITTWLQSYFTSESSFPKGSSSSDNPVEQDSNCLSNDKWKVHDKLNDYFSWKNVPIDPLTRKTWDCQTARSYLYKTLDKDTSSTASSYILATNVENKTNANILYVAGDNYSALKDKINDKKLTQTERNAANNNTHVVYAIID